MKKVGIHIAVLLCLSFGSCKNEVTPEEQKTDIEEVNSKNDNNKEEIDSLNDVTTDSNISVEEMKKKNIILHKTKAQYVIY